MRPRQLPFIALLIALGGTPAAHASPTDFPRPASLEPAIEFWIAVFTEWEEDQIVYFDGHDLSRIYQIRRLPPSNGTRERERLREKLRAVWKEELVADFEILASPAADYDSLEGRPYRLFSLLGQTREPETYATAAENLRSQRGIRARFRNGVARSARYMDAFRQIFREENVPEELVYLPHVESSYRWDARSSVGALGMWQFMSGTAKKFMVVDRAVDERLDPYTAARGSANYLKVAHEKLQSWPLAITSYNHGVDGIQNAVRETGTRDIATIIDTYEGPLFGFAGRNFYPEFLAAAEAAEMLLAAPGDLVLDEPLEFETFELPAYVKIQTLTKALELSKERILELNPAISRSAARGDLYLTKGFDLKLPPSPANPGDLFAAIPESKRPETAPRKTYRVRSGDSLAAIAVRHKTSVRTLQRLNGIRNPNRLRAGAVLRLPH